MDFALGDLEELHEASEALKCSSEFFGVEVDQLKICTEKATFTKDTIYNSNNFNLLKYLIACFLYTSIHIYIYFKNWPSKGRRKKYKFLSYLEV